MKKIVIGFSLTLLCLLFFSPAVFGGELPDLEGILTDSLEGKYTVLQ